MGGFYNVRLVLGPGGVISQRLPGYETRPQQLAMAELIERVVAEGGDAVIEAGTGTGKSLGYLVPVILAGKTVNVSTSGKALQDQLCVAPETKVLTADLRYIEADDVAEGMELIGFDEEGDGLDESGATRRRRFRRSTVTGVVRLRRPSYRLTFDDGTMIVCSAEHRWLCHRAHGTRWLTTDQMTPSAGDRAGSKVVRICDVWEEDLLESLLDPDMLGCIPVRQFGGRRAAELVKKEFVGEVDVIGIETSTRTYVAEGLASHNSKKDVPFLIETLPVEFTHAVLKGRSNYACLARVGKLRDQLGQALSTEFAFKSDAAGLAWPAVDAWIAEQEAAQADGDLEALPIALPDELKAAITISSEECTGRKCPAFEACFAERAKAKAKAAQVRIVNHHLLLLDLAMRGETGGHANLLPDADVLVLDEAHTLEEVATKVWTTEVTAERVTYLVSQVDNLTTRHPNAKQEGTEEFDRAKEWHDKVRAVGGLVGKAFIEIDGRLLKAEVTVQRLGDERPLLGPAAEAARALALEMQQGTPFWLADEERDRWLKLAELMTALAVDLEAVAWAEPDVEAVRYAEVEGEDEKRRLSLCRAPIDVAPILRTSLWGLRIGQGDEDDDGDGPPTGAWDDPLAEAFADVPDQGVKVSVIACSATIAAGGDMRFWRARVGAPRETRELIVGSPFDYRAHSLLYLPDRTIAEQLDPSKRDAEQSAVYLRRLSQEVLRLVELSGGRAFVLCTSVRVMRYLHERLTPALDGYLVLRQGELQKAELVKRFKEHGRAVLFATRSFWEGVDVAGDALSLVIIDKLPFAAPDDPIWEARKDAVTRRALARGMAPERARWAWWTELALPTATIALKQGVGRLIRTQQDRGVCAILDGRMTLKPYGATIVRSLPPMTPTSSLALVARFFGPRRVP